MAPSRKARRGKMSRRVRSKKKSTRRARKQRGGEGEVNFTIPLKYSQTMLLAGRPTPAQLAKKKAFNVSSGNITLVGTLPSGFTGGTAVEKQKFQFTLPAGKTLRSLTVKKAGGPDNTVTIAKGAPALRAEVTGQNVAVFINVSSIGLLPADSGDLTLSGVIIDTSSASAANTA